MWIELDTKDFLDAISRIKPQKLLKRVKLQEVWIGYGEETFVLDLEGAKVTKSAKGSWEGFATISLEKLLALLKIPQSSSITRIEFADGFLKIDSSKLKSDWFIADPIRDE